MLSSRRFRVLHFIFTSVIHSELILLKGTRLLSRLIFMWISSCSRTICWKDNLSSIKLPLLLCQRLVDSVYVGLFLGSLFCSIDIFVCSFANTILPWLLYLYSKSWCWIVSVFWFCSFPSVLNWLFWVSASIFKIYCQFVNVHKIPCWDLGEFFASIDQAGENWHLDNIVFLFMHMKYLPIYLIFLCYLFFDYFCSFPI